MATFLYSAGSSTSFPALSATSDAFAIQSTFPRRTGLRESFGDAIDWKTVQPYKPWSLGNAVPQVVEIQRENATLPIYHEDLTDVTDVSVPEEDMFMDIEFHNTFAPKTFAPPPVGEPSADSDLTFQSIGISAYMFSWRDSAAVEIIEDEPLYEEIPDMMDVDDEPSGYGQTVVSAIRTWFGELTRIPFKMYMNIVYADNSNETSPQPSSNDTCLAFSFACHMSGGL